MPHSAFSEDSVKQSAPVAPVVQKPDGAQVYAILQFEGKEYILIIPKKGVKEEVVNALKSSQGRTPSPQELQKLTDLGQRLIGASILKRLIVLEHKKEP